MTIHGWNGDLRTASLYFRDVPEGLQDACTKAADEIERLQALLRRCLAYDLNVELREEVRRAAEQHGPVEGK